MHLFEMEIKQECIKVYCNNNNNLFMCITISQYFIAETISFTICQYCYIICYYIYYYIVLFKHI